MKHRFLNIGETLKTYAVIAVRHVGNSTKLIPRNDGEICGIPSCFLQPFISLKVYRQNMPKNGARLQLQSDILPGVLDAIRAGVLRFAILHRRINSVTTCRPNPMSSARCSLTAV